jgi:NAD(P)-dependent dehydrogenase (short-subunit alcohol dehydrogenase family)
LEAIDENLHVAYNILTQAIVHMIRSKQMPQELKGKVAIVTGAGSGIGRAIALAFAEAGMRLVCSGRRRDRLEETATLITQSGGEALVAPVDVTDPEQVKQMVEQTLSAFGQIDVLFNNAGSFQAVGGVWEVDVATWWQDVEINLRGSMLCAHAVLPHMIERNRGIIINMSGGGAVRPSAGGSGYGCSKAALLRLTDTLALEMERIGSSVLVYAMDPGFNPTEMTEGLAHNPGAEKWLPQIAERLQKGEGRRPEECAQTSLALIRLAPAQLNGRTLYAGDDLDALIGRAEEIHNQDLLTLRFREIAR